VEEGAVRQSGEKVCVADEEREENGGSFEEGITWILTQRAQRSRRRGKRRKDNAEAQRALSFAERRKR
jgi:hypothetical protein